MSAFKGTWLSGMSSQCGDPERIHWSIPDPSAVEGDEEVKLRAFTTAADDLRTRIRGLLALIDRKQA